MTESLYDTIIIGSGPAGLTAAIYATRANLKTLVLAGSKWGGQLQLTSVIENFPGFPGGIEGPQLMTNMRKQAEHHGAEIKELDFKSADFTPSAGSGQAKKPFTLIAGENETFQAKSVIIASGADAMWLNVPGEQELIGRGVSSCATCDAAFFRNKRVIVVGGGDSAMEEALVLAKGSKDVILMHRKDSFRASEIMQQRVKETKNIHIMYNTVISEIVGEMKVEKVKVTTQPSDKSLLTKSHEELENAAAPAMLGGKVISKDAGSITWEFPIDGVFVAIGHKPNTQVFQGIDVDEKGYIKVHDHYKTNIDGVFVAGDVHDRQYRQAITAAGFGCAAALEVEKWLELQPQ